MCEKQLFRKPLPSEIEELEAVEVEEENLERKHLLFDCRYSEDEMKRIERDWGKPNAVITYNAEYGMPIEVTEK